MEFPSLQAHSEAHFFLVQCAQKSAWAGPHASHAFTADLDFFLWAVR